jgi:hypothetical protein
MRKCENCCFCVYGNKDESYMCLSFIDPMPVNPNNVCNWHRFQEEMHGSIDADEI